MKSSIIKLIMGGSGIGATEIIANSLPADPSSVVEITNIIIQIVVAIATLLGLFKKTKVAKSKN